jgi:hypothetical protein
MPSATPALGGEEGVCVHLLDENGDRTKGRTRGCDVQLWLNARRKSEVCDKRKICTLSHQLWRESLTALELKLEGRFSSESFES